MSRWLGSGLFNRNVRSTGHEEFPKFLTGFFLLHGSARNLIHEEKHAACSYHTVHQKLSLGVYENGKCKPT